MQFLSSLEVHSLVLRALYDNSHHCSICVTAKALQVNSHGRIEGWIATEGRWLQAHWTSLMGRMPWTRLESCRWRHSEVLEQGVHSFDL